MIYMVCIIVAVVLILGILFVVSIFTKDTGEGLFGGSSLSGDEVEPSGNVIGSDKTSGDVEEKPEVFQDCAVASAKVSRKRTVKSKK